MSYTEGHLSSTENTFFDSEFRQDFEDFDITSENIIDIDMFLIISAAILHCVLCSIKY